MRSDGGQAKDEIRFEKQRQICFLLGWTITHRVNNYFVVAALEVSETKASTRIGIELIGQTAAESFQSYWNIFGCFVGSGKINLAGNLERLITRIIGVPVALSVSRSRRQ